MRQWYFAYGSNLWTDQMVKRVGSLSDPRYAPRIARLANYRLVFQHLEVAGPAYANVLSPGPGVIGVVYHCSLAQLQKLDEFESGYERISVAVTDSADTVLQAAAYVIKPASEVGYGIPSADYLSKIVRGATEHCLPKSYIDFLISAARLDNSRTQITCSESAHPQ